jgi:hypothetical protein
VKIITRFFIALVLCISHVQAQDLVPDDFAKALLLETNGDSAFYEVKLPIDVYETVVRRDLGDMRVFNANEERVPHTLRKPEQTEHKETRVVLPFFPVYGSNDKNTSTELNFEIEENGAIVSLYERDVAVRAKNIKIKKYVIDTSKIGKKISSLELELTGAGDNYVKKFSIEQSKDLVNWRGFLNNGALTRLQYGGHQLQFNRITLPQYRDKYLRFLWHDASDGIQISTIYAIIKSTEKKANQSWQSSKGIVVDEKPQVYEFDIGASFPINSFNIELAGTNTLIEGQLKSRLDSSSKWVQRYRGLFYNLQVEGNRIQNDVISLSTVDDRYWRLEVNTDDGMGGIPPKFHFAWTGHSLFFLARGSGPFTLAYGSGKAEPTERPVESLLNVLNNKSQKNFVGTAYVSRSYELSGDAAKDRHFDISWQRTILWFILASGVFILGFMALRLLQQMKQED